jgi:hypothetical protein
MKVKKAKASEWPAVGIRGRRKGTGKWQRLVAELGGEIAVVTPDGPVASAQNAIHSAAHSMGMSVQTMTRGGEIYVRRKLGDEA